ncbi:MAG: DUF1624 domain-containing protein [Clostridia bacterium]|nr:DUF1624 domain-containing protein [Clostridia bacterium]
MPTKKSTEKKPRLNFIDTLRGFSVISMIFYHLCFDIYDFGIYPLGIGTLPFEAWRMSIVTVFLTLSGISQNLSRSRLRRALITIGAAYLVTAATYLFDPHMYVVFGVLHCLGFSALIYAVFKKYIDRVPFAPFVFMAAFIVLLIIKFPTVSVPHLYAFGLCDAAFTSSDYYPLLPNVFLFLFGTSLTPHLTGEKTSAFLTRTHVRPLDFAGRHALIIYLLHQPVMVGIITVLLDKGII